MSRSLSLLLLAVPGSALAAPAPSLHDFFPPGVDTAVVVNRPNAWAEAVDAVDARFGDVPAVRGLVARVRAEALLGVHPAARDWGQGLDLDRGVAWFHTAQGQRLVVGSTAPAAAEASLRALKVLEALDEVTGQRARCGQQGPYLVCEAGEIKGNARPPEGAVAPPESLAWLWSREAATHLQATGVRFHAVTGWLTQKDISYSAGFQAQFQFDSGAEGAPVSPQRAWSIFTPARKGPAQDGPARPSLVDVSTGGALKVDLDFVRAMEVLRAVAGPVLESHSAALGHLEKGLTGETAVTFDGSFAHPVLLLGVSPGPAGDQVLTGFADLLRQADVTAVTAPCHDAPTQTCLEIAVRGPHAEGLAGGMTSGDATLVRITLHTARVGDTLVVATTAPDVSRRQAPGFRSQEWPPALTGPGTSGFVLPTMAGLAGLMGASPFFTVHSDAQWFVDGEVLAGLLAATIESSALAFRAGPNTASFELTWRSM